MEKKESLQSKAGARRPPSSYTAALLRIQGANPPQPKGGEGLEWIQLCPSGTSTRALRESRDGGRSGG